MIAAMKLAALRNSLGVGIWLFQRRYSGATTSVAGFTSPRLFHHALNSSCDLIQPASLQQYDKYFGLVLKDGPTLLT